MKLLFPLVSSFLSCPLSSSYSFDPTIRLPSGNDLVYWSAKDIAVRHPHHGNYLISFGATDNTGGILNWVPRLVWRRYWALEFCRFAASGGRAVTMHSAVAEPAHGGDDVER